MKRSNTDLPPHEHKRKPGRPSATAGAQIGRDAILATGYELSRSVPLQDLSIVLVARNMGVTPALIHYYISGRDSLTSGIMNCFYRELVESWPKPIGRWDVDILEASSAIFHKYVERAGVASYAVSHNRFRTFQLVEVGERDYGIELLELFTARFVMADLSATRTAIYAHLMMEFIISTANNAINHRYPREYQDFLQTRVAALDPERFPSIHATRHGLDELDAAGAFHEACRLTLLGMQGEQLTGTMRSRDPHGSLQRNSAPITTTKPRASVEQGNDERARTAP